MLTVSHIVSSVALVAQIDISSFLILKENTVSTANIIVVHQQ